MQQLSIAIVNQYNASGDLVTLLPSLWDTEVKQGTAFPYGVFQEISNTDNPTFSDTKEDYMIQFKIYSDISGSCASLDLILVQLLAAFNNCTLSVSGYIFVFMKKVNIIKSKIDGVWEYLVLFKVELVKER
jgi:hypothetical protein